MLRWVIGMSDSLVPGVTWPSEANRADPESAGADPSAPGIDDETGYRVYQILEKLDDDLARRAVSVTPDRKLRREVAREIRGSDGSFKAKTTRGALKAFLKWAAEQLDSELVFQSESGEELRAPVPVSVSEEKAREYYGRLKDIERAVVSDGSAPHTAMLTLTGSTESAEGDPRCVVDHLREVQESWDVVRRELDRVMKNRGFERYGGPDGPERWYEYATVVEPHKSGYAHFHVAVFTSHTVDRAMFAPVLGKHVEKCPIAAPEAHRVNGEDRSVSVNAVDPTVDPDDLDPESEESPLGAVGNLGSYLAEYIGAFGDDDAGFLERPVHELVFYMACWASETQRVRFSNGANRLARAGERIRKGEEVPEPDEEEWKLKEIERPDGETHPPHTGGGVETVKIEGADHIDPPKVHPPPGASRRSQGGRGGREPPSEDLEAWTG
jgi:hypothetical protein